MNKLLLAAALAAAGAGPALADPGTAPADHGQRVYRYVVLGDTSTPIGADSSADRAADGRVPGPYARYLITHLGASRDDAIAQAERAGEIAGQVGVATIADPAFSSQERYQRTVLGRSEADILRERQDTVRRLAQAARER